MGGNEEMGRLHPALLCQAMGKLKANAAAHTVSKEREWDIESFANEWHKYIQQRRNGGKRWFVKAIATTGKLDGTDFYARRQSALPIAKHPGAAPRVRKTEQPDIRCLATPLGAEPSIE
jgi:hypothetical protein